MSALDIFLIVFSHPFLPGNTIRKSACILLDCVLYFTVYSCHSTYCTNFFLDFISIIGIQPHTPFYLNVYFKILTTQFAFTFSNKSQIIKKIFVLLKNIRKFPCFNYPLKNIPLLVFDFPTFYKNKSKC